MRRIVPLRESGRGDGPRSPTWSGRLLLALVLALAVPASAELAGAPAAAAAPELEVVDLGVLPGGLSSSANAVNDRGDVVGHSDVGDTISHAFLWRRGRMIDLGTLGGRPNDSSIANDINNRGDVVGFSTVPAGDGGFVQHAFLWRDGRMIDLGTLGGPTSVATGINDRGDVVGYSTPADQPVDGFVHAFLWRDGRMTDLGLIEGEILTIAEAVNNRGQVAVTSNGEAGLTPFVWRRGVRSPLALPAGADGGHAYDINDGGTVVGYVLADTNQAVVWRDGVPQVLGVADPFGSQAFGINDRGQIVGVGITTGAFLWERGVVTTLPSLIGGGGHAANDINERGQIVGYSPTQEGISPQEHAVLWR